MSNVREIHKNRIIKHVLGPALSSQTLWILIIFFILVEFLVSPAFSIVDEILKKNYILNDNSILRNIFELMFITLIIMIAFRFVKRRYEKWGDTLPLTVKEKTFSQHSAITDTSSISLIIGLSKAKFYGSKDQKSKEKLWQFDLTELSSLDKPQFKNKWDTSVYAAHNWRQPLICINYFLKKNRQTNVYVFCSSENKEQFKYFVEVASRIYDGDRLHINSITELLCDETREIVEQNGINFHNIEEISDCLDEAVRFLETAEDETEIVIDVTGGTKLVSVASAIVSFAQGRSFVYTKNDGEVNSGFAEYGDIGK